MLVHTAHEKAFERLPAGIGEHLGLGSSPAYWRIVVWYAANRLPVQIDAGTLVVPVEDHVMPGIVHRESPVEQNGVVVIV